MLPASILFIEGHVVPQSSSECTFKPNANKLCWLFDCFKLHGASRCTLNPSLEICIRMVVSAFHTFMICAFRGRFSTVQQALPFAQSTAMRLLRQLLKHAEISESFTNVHFSAAKLMIYFKTSAHDRRWLVRNKAFLGNGQ